MKNIIKIDNLNCYYGKSEVVHELSMKIGLKEICCLLGANGAGKTTVLLAIVGLITKKTGRIFFEERQIDNLTTYKISRLGISLSPERAPIFPQLTVEENLNMGSYKLRDNILKNSLEKEVLDLFPVLNTRKKQYGGTLSGGERQMLSIGMALMTAPQLLMLDEPSLGLAPLVIAEIFRNLKEIKARGKSIFVVEQNANIALKSADRGYLMESGKIILEGECEDLSNNETIKKAYLGIANRN